jgi:hypothetical protein
MGDFADQTNFGPNWINAQTISLAIIQVIGTYVVHLLEKNLMVISQAYCLLARRRTTLEAPEVNISSTSCLSTGMLGIACGVTK